MSSDTHNTKTNSLLIQTNLFVTALLTNWDRTNVKYCCSGIKSRRNEEFTTGDQVKILLHESVLLNKHGWSDDVGLRLKSILANVRKVDTKCRNNYLHLLKEKLGVYIQRNNDFEEKKAKGEKVSSKIDGFIKSGFDCSQLQGIEEMFNKEKETAKEHYVYRVNTPSLFTSFLSFKSINNNIEKSFDTYVYEAIKPESNNNNNLLVPITNYSINPYSRRSYQFEVDIQKKFCFLQDAVTTICESYLIWDQNEGKFRYPDAIDTNPIYADIRCGWLMIIEKSSLLSTKSIEHRYYVMYNDNKYVVKFKNLISGKEVRTLPRLVNHFYVYNENRLNVFSEGVTSLSICRDKRGINAKEVQIQFVQSKETNIEWKSHHVHHNEECVQGQPTNNPMPGTTLLALNNKLNSQDEVTTRTNKFLKNINDMTKYFKQKLTDLIKKISNANKNDKQYATVCFYLSSILKFLGRFPIVNNGFIVLISNIICELEEESSKGNFEERKVVFHSFSLEPHVTCYYFSVCFRLHLLYSPKTFCVLKTVLDSLDLVSRDIFYDEVKNRSGTDNVSDLIHYPQKTKYEDSLVKEINHVYVRPEKESTSLIFFLKNYLGIRLLKNDANDLERCITQV